MLKTLLSTLALTTALTSAAWAGPGAPTATAPADLKRPEGAPIATATRTRPIELSEAQLDTITAGGAKVGGGTEFTALGAQVGGPTASGWKEEVGGWPGR